MENRTPPTFSGPLSTEKSWRNFCWCRSLIVFISSFSLMCSMICKYVSEWRWRRILLFRNFSIFLQKPMSIQQMSPLVDIGMSCNSVFSCPQGFTSFQNSKCYAIFAKSMQWDPAKQYCAGLQMGPGWTARLAETRDQAQSAFLTDLRQSTLFNL